MTKRNKLWLVALLAAAYGIPSAFAALFAEDVTPIFRAASFVVGALLIVGAGLVVRERIGGVLFLWASAALYALVMLVPAFQRHGLETFSALMGAFYVSLAIRLALAAFAHVVLRRRHG